eukprot:5554590-Prymnesium_polylepis.1
MMAEPDSLSPEPPDSASPEPSPARGLNAPEPTSPEAAAGSAGGAGICDCKVGGNCGGVGGGGGGDSGGGDGG